LFLHVCTRFTVKVDYLIYAVSAEVHPVLSIQQLHIQLDRFYRPQRHTGWAAEFY